MRNFFLKLCLIGVFVFGFSLVLAGTYSGGNGTESTPYQISNTVDLIELSQTRGDWDKYFYQMNDITFPDDETTVDWDDDGSADGSGTSGFSAIGNSGTYFTGNYDGGDHTINYLYINRDASGQGMFGYCGDGAVVENLGLLNVDITSTASIGGSSVGGLIGMTGAGGTRTSVSSCYVTGAVYGKSAVGGMVGFNYGTSIITNSYSNAEVNASYNGNYVGGLVGENRGTTITGCYATGDVTGTGRVSGGEYGKEIGGLVGRNNDGTITDCYASGVVTGYNKVGGLVGYSSGSSNEISNSYAVGAVSGVFYEGVGGFVGQLDYTSVIRNCYSRGDVTRREDTNGRFGAFCGYSDGGVIEYSYSTSSVFSSEGNAWGDGDGLTANVGFIGDGSGTFTANFFDSDVSNQSSATGATSKTTTEMTTDALTENYTDNIYLANGWDFKGEGLNGTDEVWNIGNSRNDGYPYFDWKYSDPAIDIDAPTQQASNISFSGVSKSEVIVSWTNGNGRRRAVFGKQSSSGTASPVQNTNYATSDTFGNGDQIGSSGWYCVYNGIKSTVNVKGLSGNTDYIFQVFEYEDTTGYESYNTDTGTDNPRSQATNNQAAPNYALSFDGIDDYVDIASGLGSLTTLTIEAWFKTTGTVQTCLVGFQDDTVGSSISGAWTPVLTLKNDGNIRAEFWTGTIGSIETTSGGYNDGEFHHVALVGAGSEQTLYVDSELIGSRSGDIDISGMKYISLGTGYGRSFRGFPSSGWHYFDGVIDEVRFWSDVRSQSEIQANMHRELDGDEANLVTYYQMSNGNGDELWDDQRNGQTYDGTISGANWITVSSSDLSLPVTLSSFQATTTKTGVRLRWITESEIENQGFLIQRSEKQESDTWTEIASFKTDKSLAGHGSTSERHVYQFTDASVQQGVTYFYRLADVDFNGKVTWHESVEVQVAGETMVFALKPGYPNPFNPAVTLQYNVTKDGNTLLAVYDLRGQLVETLVQKSLTAGSYDYHWFPENLSSGVYVVRLHSGKQVQRQKIVYMK